MLARLTIIGAGGAAVTVVVLFVRMEIARRRLRRFEAMHWTCHFCHDWRHDKHIRTVSRRTPLATDATFMFTENRRYCGDRERCRNLAALWQRGQR